MKQTFRLVHDEARNRAAKACYNAPHGWTAKIEPLNRTLEQNAKFHAICGDIAKSSVQWMGKLRTADQWKVLLVSGHAVASKEEVEMVPGLEGEFVNLRESTALMSKARGSSLIEYTLAFCASHDIELNELEAA